MRPIGNARVTPRLVTVIRPARATATGDRAEGGCPAGWRKVDPRGGGGGGNRRPPTASVDGTLRALDVWRLQVAVIAVIVGPTHYQGKQGAGVVLWPRAEHHLVRPQRDGGTFSTEAAPGAVKPHLGEGGTHQAVLHGGRHWEIVQLRHGVPD